MAKEAFKLRTWIWVCLGMALTGMPWPAAPAAAAQQGVAVRTTAAATVGERFGAELYGGYLKGQSRELVYNAATGHKASELFWSIDNAYVVGLTLSARPVEKLKISVGAWTPVASDNTMDDYDWQVNGFGDWSDWSHHPETKLHRAYRIDARAAFTLASLAHRPDAATAPPVRQASLDLIGGYRWMKLDWTGYGGSYIYSSGGGIRNDIGENPAGQPGISYEQWWETPYLGLGGRLGLNRWTFSAEVIGSLWAKGRDRDNHHLRTLIFEDSFSNVRMIAVNLGVDWDLTERLALFARFDYEKYFEGKGPTTMTNYTTGVVQRLEGDAAGADYYATLYALGLRLKF